MTNNQLRYLDLERQKSTDRAVNKETHRSNLVRERQTRKANRELARHNLVIEANQQAETKAGLSKSAMAAAATKYAADASSAAHRYAAETSAAASQYAANKSYQASGYASDRSAQTQLTIAQINKEIAAARDAVNKAMNDDNINAAQERQILKNASDQFIKAMDKEISKYKIDKEMEAKWAELNLKLINSATNTGFSIAEWLQNSKQLADLAKQIAKQSKVKGKGSFPKIK